MRLSVVIGFGCLFIGVWGLDEFIGFDGVVVLLMDVV